LISKNSIEGLITQSDIVDVISGYIEVKKSGATFKAICPFHDEKTPSLVISPQKQIFHCFGCGKGGDAIKFIMEYERLSYPEAIERLALSQNYTLEYEERSQNRLDVNILERVNSFFKQHLQENKRAYSYLLDRGIKERFIEKFELGFAPDPESFMKYLRSNFFNLEECVNLGILGKDNNFFPRFINRVTFPIKSNTGKCIGFGGRTIDNHPAKYINSPQSKIFNKSRLLYGLDVARDEIYKKKEVIVCEGYMDVIMLHQGGFGHSVATLGTALTEEHIPIIKKFESKVILAYDGDNAGIEAAFRASRILSKASIEGGVVIFGGGADPADMVNQNRVDELERLLDRPKPFSEFTLDMILRKYDLGIPEQKNRAFEECKGFLSTLSPIMAEEYKEYLSSTLRISASMIKTKKIEKDRGKKSPQITQKDLAEGRIVKTLIFKPSLIDNILNYDKSLSLFHHYKEELKELMENGSNSDILLGLKVDPKIEELSEDELINQLRILMIRGYEEEILSIKNNKNLDASKRVHIITKCRDKIEQLKKGEVLPYESFGAI